MITVERADLMCLLALIAETVECRTDGEQEAYERVAGLVGGDDGAFLVGWARSTREPESVGT